MVAHEFTFMDDDMFICMNCGMYTDFDGMARGGVCKPCTLCNNVHICHKIGETPWSMGLESTSDRECCSIAAAHRAGERARQASQGL